jgi:hypothetical protein
MKDYSITQNILFAMIISCVLLYGCKSSTTSSTQSVQKSIPIFVDGLLVYYPFDGDASDASGHGHTGTIVGATLTSDRFGNANAAYSFDSTRYIIVQHSDTLKFTQALTLSAWVYEKQKGNYPGIINKGNVGNYVESFAIYISPLNKIGFLINISGTQTGRYLLESYDTLSLNTWTHIVCTYDSFVMCLYLNGQLAVTNYFPGLIFNTADNILIGKSDRSNSANPPTFFNGSIDEVYIMNRALSSAEILQMYNQSRVAN